MTWKSGGTLFSGQRRKPNFENPVKSLEVRLKIKLHTHGEAGPQPRETPSISDVHTTIGLSFLLALLRDWPYLAGYSAC